MGIFNNPDVFLWALKSAPIPKNNEFIFPYDYTLNDYNTRTFNPTKFGGAVHPQEIEAFKVALKTAVANFEVKKQLECNTAQYAIAGSCAAGVFILLFFTILGVAGLGLAAFLLIVASGVGYAIFHKEQPKEELVERERQVRTFLGKANESWGSKGFSWRASRYGAYLILTDHRIQQNRFPSTLPSYPMPSVPQRVPGTVGMAIPVAQPAYQPQKATQLPPIRNVEVRSGEQRRPYQQVVSGQMRTPAVAVNPYYGIAPPQAGGMSQVQSKVTGEMAKI